jgi:hypothetical protein
LIFTLIGLIGAAKWLEFPWVVINLQRWLDRVPITRQLETEQQ